MALAVQSHAWFLILDQDQQRDRRIAISAGFLGPDLQGDWHRHLPSPRDGQAHTVTLGAARPSGSQQARDAVYRGSVLCEDDVVGMGSWTET